MVTDDEILNSGIFDFPVFPIWENALAEGNGLNNKKILVCLSDQKGPAVQEFLQKVIASVGVDLHNDAFELYLPTGYQINFSTLDHEKGFNTALFFGLRPTDVGLNLNAQKYQPLSYLDKTYLFSDALEVIQNKPELKRPLWEGLKAVFK